MAVLVGGKAVAVDVGVFVSVGGGVAVAVAVGGCGVGVAGVSEKARQASSARNKLVTPIKKRRMGAIILILGYSITLVACGSAGTIAPR